MLNSNVRLQGESAASEHSMRGRKFFIQWVRATWAGWLLGVPIIIALALVGAD
ncbi:MAG: hypothetical protein AB7U82_16390 [Blastocatellales bacterium]